MTTRPTSITATRNLADATHDAILISALQLDDQADEMGGQEPDQTVKGTQRPIFNQLVVSEAGGPMFHEEANALLDAHEDAVRAVAEVGALRLQGAMLALHPKTANPQHKCCATPKVCKGTHRPECRSSEHTIGGQVPWPCKSLRAVGIRIDADADVVHQALAKLDRDVGRDGYPSRKKANRGYAVHATRQMDGGNGDTGACGTYFPQDTESSLEAPGADVSCQACVKALLSKREEAEAGATAEATHRCTLPPNRFLPCGCCPHQVCEDCERCAHTCECGIGETPSGDAGELCPNGQPRPECSESDPCEPCWQYQQEEGDAIEASMGLH